MTVRRSENLKAAFIEARRRWGGNGSGSTRDKTAGLVEALPRALAGVRRIVDLGCGDLDWIIPVIAAMKLEYIGVDVVPGVIDRNRDLFEDAEMTFQLITGPDDALPEADLVLCRDCLAHLPNEVVARTLRQVAAAAPRLLATTHPTTRANTDIPRSGSYRPLNLSAFPFQLGEQLLVIPDSDRKSMGLWNIRERIA